MSTNQVSASDILESGREVVQSSGASIFDRAVIVSLELGKLGTKRKVLSSAVQVDCDKDLLHVSKDILSSNSLKAINKHDADVRAYIHNRSIPSNFRSGMFLVSLDIVAELDQYLVAQAAIRIDLVRSFLWEYSALCDKARLQLASLFNPRDYPRVSKVEASFTMQWSYVEMSAPGRLESISGDIYRRAREQAAAQWQGALDEGKQLLRGELSSMVDHLADVLTPGADGIPRRIKAPEDKRSWLTDFSDFLANFQARNLAGDDELGAIVGRLHGLMSGVSVGQIKSDDAIRDTLRVAMDSAKVELSAMVVTGGRSLDMSDDDDVVAPIPAVSADPWGLV